MVTAQLNPSTVSSSAVFPVELRRSGIEQIDWKLAGYGACGYVLLICYVVIFSSLPAPVSDAPVPWILQQSEHITTTVSLPTDRISTVHIPEELLNPTGPSTTTSEVTNAVIASPGGTASTSSFDRPGRRHRRPVYGGAGGNSNRAKLNAELQNEISGSYAGLSTQATGTGTGKAFSSNPSGTLEDRFNQVTEVTRGGETDYAATGGTSGPVSMGSGIERSGRSVGEARNIGSQESVMETGLTAGGVARVGSGDISGDIIVTRQEGLGTGEKDASAVRSDATILSMVHNYMNALKFQYQQALKLNPNLEGVITVRITIQSTGRVSAAEIIRDTMGDKRFTRTVRTMIHGWRFDQVASGKSVITLTLPFTRN